MDWLLARPRAVLAVLVVAQIAATATLALAAEHDGWVWLQGEDARSAVRDAWALGRLDLPETEIGHLWLMALAPVTWVTGSSHADALPAVVLFQVLVLGPVALLCVYALAGRIAGRLLGLWAALLWVVLPFAMIPFGDSRHDEVWINRVLPQLLGLTTAPEYPATVAALASALFLARSLDARSWTDAALGGLLLGAAAGIYLPSLLVAIGAALAYAVARNWRQALVFFGAVAAAVLVVLLFRERAVGRMPDVALEFDLDRFRGEMDGLREYLWSQRLVQWAPLAGLVAVLSLRRYALAALLAGWLGAFLVAKGSEEGATVGSGIFWTTLQVAMPAYLLLLAAISLLVPTSARRLGDRVRPVVSAPVSRRWVVVAAVLVVLVPVVWIVAASL